MISPVGIFFFLRLPFRLEGAEEQDMHMETKYANSIATNHGGICKGNGGGCT